MSRPVSRQHGTGGSGNKEGSGNSGCCPAPRRPPEPGTKRRPPQPAPSARSIHRPRTRNGGRHRCQPPLSGFAPHRTPHLIPVRFSCDRRPAKRYVAAYAGTIRRRFGRPPFGGRPHLESPSSSCPASAKAIAVSAMDCISCTRSGSHQLVGIATFRDRAIGRFPRRSSHFLPASLATTLNVLAVRRLYLPMIGS